MVTVPKKAVAVTSPSLPWCFAGSTWHLILGCPVWQTLGAPTRKAFVQLLTTPAWPIPKNTIYYNIHCIRAYKYVTAVDKVQCNCIFWDHYPKHCTCLLAWWRAPTDPVAWSERPRTALQRWGKKSVFYGENGNIWSIMRTKIHIELVKERKNT